MTMIAFQSRAGWIGALLIVLVSAAGLLPLASVSAQGGNLLDNPNFEQAHGNGMDLTAPPGWSIWAANAPRNEGWQNLTPVAEGTSDPRFVHEGFGSFHAYKQWATFNVSIYQTVSGITPGSTLRLSAFGRMWSCQERDGQAPCLTGSSVRNEDNTGASFRVGLDPTGANDPNAGTIVWSGGIAPYNGYQQVSVDATASGGTVTVVLNARMEWPSEHQDVFWDQAALTVVAPPGNAAAPPGNAAAPAPVSSGQTTGGGEASGGGQPAASQPTPASGVTDTNLAPVVVPQGPREDGSVVHTVRAGDTLAGIAVAYNVTIDDLLQRNGLPAGTRFIYPGQELIIVPSPESADAEEAAASEVEEVTAGDEGEAPETDAGEAEAAEAASAEPTVQPIEEYDPAPVAEAAVPMLNLEAASVSRVCATLFEDTNPNRLRESGEGLLAGGEVALSQGGAVLDSAITRDEDQPHCFEDLAPGQYMVSLTLPQGYGATTPTAYTLNVAPGQTVEALFGAARGFVPPQPPPISGGGLLSEEAGAEADTRTTLLDTLAQNSGLIVLGLAGIVLVGGLVVSLLLRR